MEGVVGGTRRGIVVECKHTGSVGRPVVQKLHSAIATYDFDETDIRRMAEEVGPDLYNGRIEIICDEMLHPYDPTGSIDAPLHEAVRDVENLDVDELPPAHRPASLEPVVIVTARIRATFETSVGVIHRVDETDGVVVHAGRSGATVLTGSIADLVASNLSQTIDLDEKALAEGFNEVSVDRFQRNSGVESQVGAVEPAVAQREWNREPGDQEEDSHPPAHVHRRSTAHVR
jgi:restriction endonuclease Mrr